MIKKHMQKATGRNNFLSNEPLKIFQMYLQRLSEAPSKNPGHAASY